LLLIALFFDSFYEQEAHIAVPASALHGSNKPPAVRSILYRMVTASIECSSPLFPPRGQVRKPPSRFQILAAPQNKI